MRGSFLETAPRKTAEHTVKHRDGGVGLVAAKHRGGGKKFGGRNNIKLAFYLTGSLLGQCQLYCQQQPCTKSTMHIKTLQQREDIANLWYEDVKQNTNMLQVLS